MKTLWNTIVDHLIEEAMRTPYYHLKDYMERFWVIPYAGEGSHSANGCVKLSFWSRPLGRLLQQFGIAARVHHILRSDYDEAFHDHPWPYLTIVLRGGYWEITPEYDESGLYIGDKRVWYGPGSVIRRKANSWHRIELPEGQTAWTLFITGKKKQKWGFLIVPRNKVRYEDFLGLPIRDED